MNKYKYLTILLLSITPLFCNGQIDFNYDFKKYQFSQSNDDDLIDLNLFDIENVALYTFRRNPAFYDLYYNNNDFFASINMHKINKSVLICSLTNRKDDGNYLHYNGDRISSRHFLAGSEKKLDMGTLFGAIALETSTNKNVHLNYASDAQDYYPYLVGDTLGKGTIDYKRHMIKGGFSFNHKGITYGFSGSYKGITSAKQVDPRISTYSSWLRLNFGIAFIKDNTLFAFKIYPEFNRQNISANNYYNQSATYHQYYGFGLWRDDEIVAGNGYASLLTINGYGVDLSILTPQKNGYAISYNVVYNHRIMDTETVHSNGGTMTYKNLFSFTNHHFKPQISISKTTKTYSLHLTIVSNNNKKNGTEYIYDKVLVNKQQNLYAERKLGKNEMYQQVSSDNNVYFKITKQLSHQHSLSILTGARHLYFKEKYKFPTKKIINNSITSNIGLEYRTQFKKYDFQVQSRYHITKSFKNTFDVPIEKAVIQQAYIPYAIRSGKNRRLITNMTCACKMNNNKSIGINLLYKHYNREHVSDYKISNDTWTKDHKTEKYQISLFYTF